VGGPNPTAPQLGDTIRELREKRDLTLEDLAGLARIHTTTLSKIERGITNPQWESVRSVADAFGIDASALLRLAEMMTRAGRKPTP
jgi:transcriptional regulator with XRE-family HTH domain